MLAIALRIASPEERNQLHFTIVRHDLTEEVAIFARAVEEAGYGLESAPSHGGEEDERTCITTNHLDDSRLAGSE